MIHETSIGNIVTDKLPDLPFNIPAGVLKYKVRARWGSIAYIFLVYPDRTEWRHVNVKDGKLVPGGLKGENLSRRRARHDGFRVQHVTAEYYVPANGIFGRREQHEYETWEHYVDRMKNMLDTATRNLKRRRIPYRTDHP